MEYQVAVDEYYNHEFDFVLYAGEWVADGDLEPDVLAELVGRGVLVPDGVVGEPEPEPVDDN